AAPSWRWLNSVALASASFTSSKALTASSGSLSSLCKSCEDVNLSSGASNVAAHGMKRRWKFTHPRNWRSSYMVVG
ncbi:hypothetical protein T02_14334, partial [Trichinella nativa]